MSTITNKCDPEKRGNAVNAQAVAQEILCKAVNRYTEVHNEVKSAYSKMRSERNPCRISPKINTHVYTHENSPYTFFGWRLGEMAEEGSLTVRTTKQCHICFFAPPVHIEGQSHATSFRQSAEALYYTNEGGLRCNVDHTGKQAKDDKLRLGGLNLFDEKVAQGTSAWRTLDHTVTQALAKRAKQQPTSSFWQEVGTVTQYTSLCRHRHRVQHL